jgi:hypothetical protein
LFSLRERDVIDIKTTALVLPMPFYVACMSPIVNEADATVLRPRVLDCRQLPRPHKVPSAPLQE